MIHWSKLRLVDDDFGQPISSAVDFRFALREPFESRQIPGNGLASRHWHASFLPCGLPHENPDWPETWGPRSWHEVDWEGFERALRSADAVFEMSCLEGALSSLSRGRMDQAFDLVRVHLAVDESQLLALFDQHGIDAFDWHLTPHLKRSPSAEATEEKTR